MVENDGITLLITEEFDPHTDAVIEKLSRPYLRLNTDAYLEKFFLCSKVGRENYINYECSYSSVDITKARSAYFRRPDTPRVISLLSDKQDKALYTSEIKDYLRQIYESISGCVWLTHPAQSEKMSGRINQLRIARSLGFSIPDTLITSSAIEAEKFFLDCQGDVVIKSINSRSAIHGSNFSEIFYTESVKLSDISYLKKSASPICPFLLQKKISSAYEIRSTYVGGKIFSARIDSEILDWRREGNDEKISTYSLPEEVNSLIKKYMQTCDLKMGCIDIIRSINGDYIFLEVNPNGQWLWIEHATHLPISQEIANFLDSA